MANHKYLDVYDDRGQDVLHMPVIELPNHTIEVDGLTLAGLTAGTTAGVVDVTNKRFVTDAELVALALLTPETGPLLVLEANSIHLLQSNVGVDMTHAASHSVMAVPGAKKYVVTHIVLLNATDDISGVTLSFGFTAAAYTDVVAGASYALDDPLKQAIAYPLDGSTYGTIAADLKVKVAAPIATGTLDIQVFGFEL